MADAVIPSHMSQNLDQDGPGLRKEKRPFSPSNDEPNTESAPNTRVKLLAASNPGVRDGERGGGNYYNTLDYSKMNGSSSGNGNSGGNGDGRDGSSSFPGPYSPHHLNTNNLHAPPPPPQLSHYDSQNPLNAPNHPQQHHHHYYPSNSVSPGPHAQMSQAQATTQAVMQAMAGSGGQAPKRPYRQRRKDPSCDACRERKVKCDATETASCNECKSRSVKCQFTKETNRRMSSIKQVQDLEKQVLQYKNRIRELESRHPNSGNMGMNNNGHSVSIPEIGAMPQRRPQAPPLSQNLAAVRSHVRDYCRGVFKPPPPYRQVPTLPNLTQNMEELGVRLPPKQIGEILIRSYYETIHSIIPILHWPSFSEMYEKVMAKGDLSGVPSVWASTLFAVFACGTIHTPDPEIRKLYPDRGKNFAEYSRRLTDLFNDEFTMEHARSALLISIFLTEVNCKSAAWTWLGSTVRIAQDIGLHRETGPWTVVEGEMRRRVWWGIYAWDRLLSMELGRVLLIEDADCDIPMPSPMDDHLIYDGAQLNQAVHSNAANSQHIQTTIHVVRMIEPLLRTLQAPVVSGPALSMFESHINQCRGVFPQHCHPYHPAPLEPRLLQPIFQLQNCQIVLQRHNLSTSCSLETRSEALRNCITSSKDTSQLLTRVKQYDTSQSSKNISWKDAVASAATTMVCSHVWRCMLFLCFAGLYDDALTCVEFSTAVGDFRSNNLACGRYMYGFLRCLQDKLHNGIDLWKDDMMIALVSGDVQGSTESSWVWNGSETGTALNNGTNSPPVHSPVTGKFQGQTGGDEAGRQGQDEKDWNAWNEVKEILLQLKRDQNEHRDRQEMREREIMEREREQQQQKQQQQYQQSQLPPPQQGWESREMPKPLQPLQPMQQGQNSSNGGGTSGSGSNGSSGSSGTSRISIAMII